MKRLCLFLIFSSALFGADVTGKWSGNIEVVDPTSGDKISTPVKAEFDQKANTVSGKIGRAEDQDIETIKNGTLEGKTIRFEVQPPEATSAMKFTLVLVSDDRIEGEMNGAIDVGKISGKVTLQKVK
jgi:hypothetical protein